MASLGVPAAGQAIALNCLVPAGRNADASQPALRFGIYPGGGAGTVNPTAAARPEDPVKRLAAVQALAGTTPFVVRLYSPWTGEPTTAGADRWLDDEIAGYTTAGLQVELVVRYKPSATDTTTAPAAFADHVRAIVRRYGPDGRFVSLQVTNEANMREAPDASDGAFGGAAEALVKGVIAAKDQARQAGHDQLRIGFSWAYDERPLASSEFWTTLRLLGGKAFADAVDWVGLDSYPGTWAPRIAVSQLLPGLAASAVKDSIRALRDCLMPLAGLGDATTLHIAENGFPTGPGRSEELQAHVLDAMVQRVDAIRSTYNISDYRWFDLRDSSTADPSFESQYGITRDDYSPKPAYATYQSLIARRGVRHAAAPATCRSSPLKVSVPRWKDRRMTALVLRVGAKVVKVVRRSRVPRSLQVSVASGRRTISFKLTTKRRDRRVTRVSRRTYQVC